MTSQAISQLRNRITEFTFEFNTKIARELKLAYYELNSLDSDSYKQELKELASYWYSNGLDVNVWEG